MPVPLRNVYYLLCYAWDRWDLHGMVDVHALSGDRAENLLARVLRDGVSGLVRRGLDRGYVPEAEEGRCPRGKILISRTMQRMLVPQGRVACQVDDLRRDVPHNRIIKAAMTALIGLPSLDGQIRTGLADLRRRMHDVSDVELSVSAFRGVQLHRNVAAYAFVIDVCQLVARSMLPEPGTGRRRFHPFTGSEQEMGLLFEAFVRNFLRREQDVFSVAASKVPWDAVPLEGSDLSWLPEMRTDVVLTRPSQRIAIEAKFYASPYQSHHGSRTLHSGHLYQLQAYLSHLRACPGPAPLGVLLYARSGESPRLDYRLSGHTVLVRSLDLATEWKAVRRQLLDLVDELADRYDEKHPGCGQDVADGLQAG